MLVYTIQGLIEYDQLEVTDHITLEDNARIFATEWRLKGELVRRDVNVNMLRPLQMQATPGAVGG